jgi:hypothetical protein
MITLPQRFLASFHEFGDRIADQTIDPSGCCCSPSSPAGSSHTRRDLLLGPPEDMFATHITRLAKQLDKFLTPVPDPDMIVQEYDVREYPYDEDVRDEKELTKDAALLDVTASTSQSDERQTTEVGKEDHDAAPPLLEVVSMESSENNDNVSVLDDTASSSSSSCADGDIKDKAAPTPSDVDAKPADPVNNETASAECVEAELYQAAKEFPDDEKDEAFYSSSEGPTGADSFIDCSSVPQIVFDEALETAHVANSPHDKKTLLGDVKDIPEGESTTQTSTEHDEPLEETTRYNLEDLKRHKIL